MASDNAGKVMYSLNVLDTNMLTLQLFLVSHFLIKNNRDFISYTCAACLMAKDSFIHGFLIEMHAHYHWIINHFEISRIKKTNKKA